MSCPVVAPGFVTPPPNHDTAIGPRQPAAANRLGKGVMTRCAMRLNRPAKAGRVSRQGGVPEVPGSRYIRVRRGCVCTAHQTGPRSAARPVPGSPGHQSGDRAKLVNGLTGPMQARGSGHQRSARRPLSPTPSLKERYPSS